MNDFDRYLEAELRLLLDPVVASRPPFRKGRLEGDGVSQPHLVTEAAPEATLMVEPVVVTLPVAPASTL